MGTAVSEVKRELEKIIESFVQKCCAGDDELRECFVKILEMSHVKRC